MNTDQTYVTWPRAHEPAGADIHAVNRGVTSASPQQVWEWVTRPDLWHHFYDNAKRIEHLDGPWPRLGLGSRFRWSTFGTTVTTTVTEFEPFERLAWTGSGAGSTGHHAWLLRADGGGGTTIITEETQRGRMARLSRPLFRPRMLRQHQLWVDGLARVSAAGPPPRTGAPADGAA
ncbi:SRPBCC family protein [Umezawaea tangerina]|uniref:Polyketide cyclase/dehydrase/lipid transport protein n=1 Tax=Umezawaea tangerina TaxID=84725 RepID=A0A2T0T7B6_9PSEU|nr:SRPBCC family protein [Umezawaea tangerina]PRY41560.1 polyketide cyclase/dehydrase/lipid transport protein [Umezawaea tangerina]